MIHFPPISGVPFRRDPVQTSGEGYTLYQRDDGASWVYLSRWTPDVASMLVESRVPRIIITEHWTEPTLEPFRPHVSQIEDLSLLSAHLTDVALLAEMPALRTLGLHHSTKGVPFRHLARLRECQIASPATLGDVCQAPGLTSLSLHEITFKNLRMLEGLSLTSMELSGRHKTSLDGIEALPLQELTLGLRRLESLAPLATLPLRRLSIHEGRALRDGEVVGGIATLSHLEFRESAALRSLDFVAQLGALEGLFIEDTALSDATVSLRALSALQELRTLTLHGEKYGLRNLADLESLGSLTGLTHLTVHKGPEAIDHLRWVRTLERLQTFWLGKTRVRDGDLTPLLDLPSIERVTLVPTYSNYSHTDQTFGAAMRERLAARGSGA